MNLNFQTSLRRALFILFLPALCCALPLAADDKAVAPVDAKQLMGAWILIGSPGKTIDPPAKGGRYLFFGDNQWAITQANPDSGDVMFHHGGNYTVSGNDYAETIQYANPSTATLVGKTLKFKLRIEGDLLMKEGVENEWNEVWKRVK